MTMKKILAGVLAAASILSVSATAFADDTTQTFTGTSQPPANGVSYDVSADVSYGTVDCILPAASVLAKSSVVVNPYGAAVKSEKKDATKLTNTSFIASPYYMVLNNDTEGGLKVIATASVKKATGLVIVDGKAKAPDGWTTVTGKNADDYNPLVSYDKLSLKYTDKEKTVIDTENSKGGGESAKQAMNTAVWLVGGTDTDVIALGEAKYADTSEDPVPAAGDTFRVDLAAKGTTGGTLMWLGKATNTSTPAEGYFTVMGDLNPNIDKEGYSWGKENLSLSIVLKLVPTVVEP